MSDPTRSVEAVIAKVEALTAFATRSVYVVAGSGGRRKCRYCLRESFAGQPEHYGRFDGTGLNDCIATHIAGLTDLVSVLRRQQEQVERVRERLKAGSNILQIWSDELRAGRLGANPADLFSVASSDLRIRAEELSFSSASPGQTAPPEKP